MRFGLTSVALCVSLLVLRANLGEAGGASTQCNQCLTVLGDGDMEWFDSSFEALFGDAFFNEMIGNMTANMTTIFDYGAINDCSLPNIVTCSAGTHCMTYSQGTFMDMKIPEMFRMRIQTEVLVQDCFIDFLGNAADEGDPASVFGSVEAETCDQYKQSLCGAITSESFSEQGVTVKLTCKFDCCAGSDCLQPAVKRFTARLGFNLGGRARRAEVSFARSERQQLQAEFARVRRGEVPADFDPTPYEQAMNDAFAGVSSYIGCAVTDYEVGEDGYTYLTFTLSFGSQYDIQTSTVIASVESFAAGEADYVDGTLEVRREGSSASLGVSMLALFATVVALMCN